MNALRILGTGMDVQLELTENMCVSAQAVTCVNAELSEVMVEQLRTPMGTMASATLRGANIVAIDVAIRDSSEK